MMELFQYVILIEKGEFILNNNLKLESSNSKLNLTLKLSVFFIFTFFLFSLLSFLTFNISNYNLTINKAFAQSTVETGLNSAAATAPVELKVSSNPVVMNGIYDVPVAAKSFNMVFNTAGGSLKNFNLKVKKFQENFLFDRSALDSKTVELAGPFSLDLNFTDGSDEVTVNDSQIQYLVREENTSASIKKITFTSPVPVNINTPERRVLVTKVYEIDTEKQLIKMTLKIKNESSSPIALGAKSEKGFAMKFLSNIGENAMDDEAVADLAGSLYKSITNSNEYKHEFKPSNLSDTRWLGIRDSYYAGIIAFDDVKPVSADIKAAGVALKDHKGFVSNYYINFPRVDLDASEAKTFNFTIYFGIKSYDDLKKIGRGFEEICEFNFLALLIMQALVFFYGISKNYGLAIILLTVAIKLILQPLTNKQTKSMKEMQKIQPYINDIKAKYSNDAQKMNEEIMKLYKEHGVNPFGGCLPLLLQLPVLFALFTALRSSVELKGEGFLWVPDLSLADPTWILPIAIAVSMHFQQAQMQTDPQQAAAFKFMPIFMFFITYTLPAGVLLYWGVSNILQVAQQWYDSRGEKQPEVQVIMPPEKDGKKK
ncbi:MAG: membrane protein insertase YidC [Candidatus Wallbacteria bacterium]